MNIEFHEFSKDASFNTFNHTEISKQFKGPEDGTSVKTYDKATGVFLSLFKIAAKITDETGKSTYINKKSLSNLAVRYYQAKNDPTDRMLVQKLNHYYLQYKRHGEESRAFIAIRGSVADILKGKQVKTLESIIVAATNPKTLKKWQTKENQKIDVFLESLKQAGFG